MRTAVPRASTVKQKRRGPYTVSARGGRGKSPARPREPAEARRRCGARTVFRADEATIAKTVQRRENGHRVDLPLVWLMAIRDAGNLHMADPWHVALEFREHVSLGAPHMEHVELDLQAGVADAGDHLARAGDGRVEVAGCGLRGQRLKQECHSAALALLESDVQVVPECGECPGLINGCHNARHDMNGRGARTGAPRQRRRKSPAEVVLAARECPEAEITGLIAARRVDAKKPEPTALHRLPDLVGRMVVGELHLDGFETGCRCGIDPRDQADLRKQHAKIGGEAGHLGISGESAADIRSCPLDNSKRLLFVIWKRRSQPMQRPYPWEASYPDGVSADAAIEISTLPRLLDKAVDAFADRIVFEFRERTMTYRDLGKAVDAMAAACLANGLGAGSTVALYLPNLPAHPISLFGVTKAGGRIAHLSPLDAERVLVHKLSDSGAQTLVTVNVSPLYDMALRLFEAGHVDRLVVVDDAAFGPSGLATHVLPRRAGVVAFADFLASAHRPVVWPDVVPDQIALLQYTGGTTGMPKGAMLTHGNITAAVSIYAAWGKALPLGPPEHDKIILVLPLFHIYALTSVMMRQIERGATMLLRQRFDAEQILADITEKKATMFPGVPTMWIALINHPMFETADLSSLTYAASGGAPLPVEVARKFERRTGMRLAGGWGMTETAPAGTQVPASGKPKPGTIGLPLPGLIMDIAALDDPARALPPGEVGEIRIEGPNVMSGYWNRPEETAQSFVGRKFLTGDIGYMDEEGYFFIVDRKKDMIISGGFNVYPQMIEQAIYEHPDVAEAIVLGVPDPYRGEAAKAFVTLKPGAGRFTIDELKAFLAGKVGRHEMPVAVEFRDSLPRTTVGKLSRADLRAEVRAKEAS